MTTAGNVAPTTLLLGIEDAACGYSVSVRKGAHRPPYEGAESKVRAQMERLVQRKLCRSGIDRSSGCQ